MTDFQPARGTRDILPATHQRFRHIIETARDIAGRFCFEQMDTPLFERSELFARGIGESTDVVSKEMYSFLARDGETSLTLRPENTASIMRAYLHNGMASQGIAKLFYAGPMFRYERPQKGRYRQFHQIGVELIGTESVQADIECIAAGHMILSALGLSDKITLELNTLGDQESRQNYRAVLVDYFTQHKSQLSADSLQRLEKNPLRILDSKDEGDRELLINAPRLEEHLNTLSKNFYKDLCAGLDLLGLSYQHNPYLVRGLDYYCHTAFEFTTDTLGAQGTVMGGGRYDGLAQALGGSAVAGIGWAAGIERLELMLTQNQYQLCNAVIIPTGADTQNAAMSIAYDLRNAGLNIEMGYGGNVKKRIAKAHKQGLRWALILGSEEMENKQITLRDMQTGEQSAIAQQDLAAKLFDLLGLSA